MSSNLVPCTMLHQKGHVDLGEPFGELREFWMSLGT